MMRRAWSHFYNYFELWLLASLVVVLVFCFGVAYGRRQPAQCHRSEDSCVPVYQGDTWRLRPVTP